MAWAITCPYQAGGSPLHPPGQKLRLHLPHRITLARALAGPAKRIRRDLSEAPAGAFTRVGPALLHDLGPARAADLARVVQSYAAYGTYSITSSASTNSSSVTLGLSASAVLRLTVR
jgi:hypothetical protein